MHKKYSQTMIEKRESYPKECKILDIGDYKALRCGCFDKIKDIKKNLHKYTKYPNAYIVTTKKERFNFKKHNSNNTYIKSYHGEFEPIVKNVDNIKTGTPRNRRVEIKAVALQKDKQESTVKDRDSYGICKNNYYTGRLKHIDIKDRRGYVYNLSQNIDNNLSLIDFDINSVNDLNTSFNDKSIIELMALLKNNKKNYIDVLESKDPFYGIYVGGKYYQYIDEDYKYRKDVDWEYRLNARWEIFNDGYFESKKNIDKKINETKIQYFQLLSNMIDRNYDEKVFNMQLMTIDIRYNYYALLLGKYKKLLNKREKQLINGNTTIDDVNHIRERYENIKMLKEMYGSQEKKKIDRKLYMFLNTIECIELIDKEKLKKFLRETNIGLKLQDRFIERSGYFPEYIDKMKLNLFVEHKEVDSVGWYDTVGFQFDLPVEWSDERAQIIKIEQNNYKIQRKSIEKRLEQNTDSLYYQFNSNQKHLELLKNELKNLYKRIIQLDDIQNNIIEGFKKDPNREQDLIKIKVLNKKYEIVMKRTEVYGILLRLYHLSNADNIKFLIKNDLGIK